MKKRTASSYLLDCSRVVYSQDLKFQRVPVVSRRDYTYPKFSLCFGNAGFAPFNSRDWKIGIHKKPQKQMAQTQKMLASHYANLQTTQESEKNLEVLFNKAYYDFVPNKDFGEGFGKDLLKRIEEAGRKHEKRLVVVETSNYTNILGFARPNEDKYKYLKRWLELKGCQDVRFELSHYTLNIFAAKKTLQLVIYFHPTTQQ